MRLDAALVGRGLARSRSDATELIRGGAIRVNGAYAHKPAATVTDADDIAVATTRVARVGRAAYKLEEAFARFGACDPDPLDVTGRRCLDVGASTGGFTEVLLERGAAHVTALDVGRGQLVPALRADPRVADMPGRNIRDVTPGELGGPFHAVVADLSFISLGVVMPALAALVAPDGHAVLLVKPQFEVGRDRLGKHGIVRSPRDQELAIREVAGAVRRAGLYPRAVAPTGLAGTNGNHEYLMWVTTRPELALVDDDATASNAVQAFEGE